MAAEVLKLLLVVGGSSPWALVGLVGLLIMGLLGGIIYMLVKNQRATIETKQQTETIASNHLHGLPDMAATLERIERAIVEQSKEARVNSQVIREMLIQLVAESKR